MKMILIAAAALSLAGCQTVPDVNAVETAVSRAVAAEGVVAARCALGPQTAAEQLAQTTARLLFASQFGPLMSTDQRGRYDLAVARTNEACAPKMPAFPVEPTTAPPDDAPTSP